MRWWLWVVALFLQTRGIEFALKLDPLQKKCYSEHIGKGTLLVAKSWSDEKVSPVGLMVLNPTGHVIYQASGDPEYSTAFTSTLTGAHQICVENKAKAAGYVNLHLVWGPEARDYSQIAKKEHLEPSLTFLRQSEDMLRAYHRDLLYLRSRETRMRKANDMTSFRIMAFGLCTTFVVVLSGVFQSYYFRRFFKSKKIS